MQPRDSGRTAQTVTVCDNNYQKNYSYEDGEAKYQQYIMTFLITCKFFTDTYTVEHKHLLVSACMSQHDIVHVHPIYAVPNLLACA